MKHYPKIDGLRAIAVFGVLLSHYLPHDNVVHLMPWGLLGVQLFFVISGYLITGILIQSGEVSHWTRRRLLLKNFYARRFLRIFPPYYALLMVYLLVGVEFEHGSLAATFLYYFNVYASYVPADYHYLGHLWTLCIEEQFYLVWPLLLLLIPKKWLTKFVILLMLMSPVSRFLLSVQGCDYLFIRNLPSSALDSLLGGALLSLIHLGYAERLRGYWERSFRWVFIGGVIIYLQSRFFPFGAHDNVCWGLFASALAGMAVVHYATLNGRTWFDQLLNLAFMRYIGKISYGIYLYQFLTLYPLYKLITILEHPRWLQNEWAFASVWAVLTLMTAMCSWTFFERPLNRLKRFYTYK